MNGSAAQTINGDFVFDDLAIQASGTVSVVNDTIEILHELAPSSGTLNTNGLLLMRSRAIGDSRIDNVTGIVNGDVTVQRYIEAGQTGWRFLSAPVQGATLADWNDDFITSGFPGSDFPSFYFTSIMFYDETEVGDQDSGFVFPTSINNSIPVSSSAWVYCGDSLQGTAPFMIDVTGPINSGDLTYPISYSNNTSATADGWNHVSNPYVSAIDWDAAGWTKTNVDAGVYIWNTDLNIYASYVGGIGVNGGSNVIASSQGFTLKPMQSRLP